MRRLRKTAAPHSTPVSLEVSKDGFKWTATVERHHIIPVNSHILAAYRGRLPKLSSQP